MGKMSRGSEEGGQGTMRTIRSSGADRYNALRALEAAGVSKSGLLLKARGTSASWRSLISDDAGLCRFVSIKGQGGSREVTDFNPPARALLRI